MTKSIVTTLVLYLKGDRILLAMKKRGFGAGRWNGVGGKVTPGESIEQSMIRESEEEIALIPISWEKVAVHDFVNLDRDGKEYHIIVHAFICRQWKGEPVETEEMAPKWFKLSDIPYDRMWQDDLVWLPQVLLGKKLKSTFTFDKNDNMFSVKIDIVKKLN
jgi:ADP-ribose pyrophosphatase YjhB (NUDIX family)